MLALRGRWFDRRVPDSRWPSFVVSVAFTVLVFAVALESMRRAPRLSSSPPVDRPTPITLRLTPPPPAPRRQARPNALRGAPPAPSTGAPADSAGVPNAGANRPSGNSAPATGGAPGGDAPSIPIGTGARVTSETPFVLHYRDSLARIKSDSAFREMARQHVPTGQEKFLLESSQRAADKLARRATTVGAAADVHVGLGQGIDGVGAVGGGALGASIGVPLLSKGKSAEQRKKDEAIDADYRQRLQRLQARVAAVRDSIRADSIAKARARIVPE